MNPNQIQKKQPDKSSINDITKSFNNSVKVSAYLLYDNGTISKDIFKDGRYIRDSINSFVDCVAENNFFKKIKIIVFGKTPELTFLVKEGKKSVIKKTFDLDGKKEFFIDKTNCVESTEIQFKKNEIEIFKKNIDFTVYE